MRNALAILSPRSASGSMILSVVVHGVLAGAVVAALHIAPTPAVEPEDVTLDLSEPMFDRPPDPEIKPQKVARSPTMAPPAVAKTDVPDSRPQELHDEKGDVAGTQTARPESVSTGATTAGTAATTPYYKIKPKYPKAALAAGVEGWVLMKVDINENGEVENVRIVDGEQRNMFQDEARRAVSKYKYRPFIDGEGHAIRKADHQVRVDFKLVESNGGAESTSL